MWPDYCKKETLARRLDLEIGAVDQYVKRGLLPSPHKVGEALLFGISSYGLLSYPRGSRG